MPLLEERISRGLNEGVQHIGGRSPLSEPSVHNVRMEQIKRRERETVLLEPMKKVLSMCREV